MSSFQTDVLDNIARVVGGTVNPNDSTFFSGAINEDQTGVAGLTGCYSAAPDNIEALPVGIVLSDKFVAELESIGSMDTVDNVHLLVLVSSENSPAANRQLTPFRDSVPNAFIAHMQAFTTPSAMDFFVTDGETGVYDWGGAQYLSWHFTVRVRRNIGVIYVP